MDNYWSIKLQSMAIIVKMGICPHERLAPQQAIVEVEVFVPYEKLSNPSKIEDVVNYDLFFQKIRSIEESGHIDLIETIAESLAEVCFNDEKVCRAIISIQKPHIYNGSAVPKVELVITREMWMSMTLSSLPS